MRPSSQTWAVPSSKSVTLRRWPDEAEVLAFHEASGNLHLLTPLAAAVLERLMARESTIDDLVSAVPHLDRDAAQTIVRTLDALGLITAVRQ